MSKNAACTPDRCAHGNFCCPNGCKDTLELDEPTAASRPRLPIAEIVVETDGGPWADHNMPCAVCRSRHAVLNLNNGRFEPCWECQDEGWRTSRFSISLGPVMVMTGGRNG